tara:strand:- start:9468 stop:12101 length:2634 start_codon:yes stop_codon:yes gene_type:complete
MATRNPNRTQVDIPFSSVPIVSPTVTAGRGAVVGPAQVQPSKLVSLSNALGVATDIIPTVTAIKGLEKQQGLRAGELAAKAEIDAKDAFSKMEQAGRKAVEAGTLKESQLPSFQFAFKDGIAKRAAGDYNSLLVSQLKRVNENLENGRNGAEYAQELTTEAYEQFAERFNNDPIMLQSFNTAIQGYNRNFSEQVIRARDRALKDNHIKNVTSSTINEIETIIKTEDLPNELIGDIFSVGIEGLTEAESTRVGMNSVNSAFYNLTEGKPTERKFEQARELLDNVASSRTQSGIPIQNLEKEGELYHVLRARLNRYKELVEKTGEKESKKIGQEYAYKFQVFVGNWLRSRSAEDADKIRTSLTTMFGSDVITDEKFEEVIEGLRKQNADAVIIDLIENSIDITEAESETLLELNRGLDGFINQNLQLPFTTDEKTLENVYDLANNMGRNGLGYDVSAIEQQTGVLLDQTQASAAKFSYDEGRKTIIGTTVGKDSKTISQIGRKIKTSGDIIEGGIERDPRILNFGIKNTQIGAELSKYGFKFDDITEEYIERVDESIRDKVSQIEGEPSLEALNEIRKQSLDEHQAWLDGQYKGIQEEIILGLVTTSEIDTTFINTRIQNLQSNLQDVKPVSYFDPDVNKQVSQNLPNTNRDYLLRITNNVPVRFGGQFKNVDLTEEQIKDIRREIGWESPADVPRGTKTGDIDWRNVPLFANSAWRGENSIWNFDNNDSVLKTALAEFNKLEGKAPDKEKTPHAYFWANTFGIRNAVMFESMLETQDLLQQAFEAVDKNTVDPQRKQLQADIDQQASEIQRFGRGTRIGIEPSKIDSASSEFEAFRETAPVSSRLQERRDALELKRRQAYYLDNVYNQNIEYYKIFNK